MLRECANCQWFEPAAPDSLLGSCRRVAPSSSDGFPNTRPIDWCGDWSSGLSQGRPKDGDR